MKKTILLFLSLSIFFIAQAQVSKTINVATAGRLSTLLTADEKTTVTNLTLSGNIDARDVKCMRDEITAMAVLDISAASIQEYIGSAGTSSTSSLFYPANEMPQHSFRNPNTVTGNVTLKTITLPAAITSIGSSAFSGCGGLSGSLILPNSVTSIGSSAFSYCSGLTGRLTIPNSVTSIGSSAFSYCRGLTGSLTIPNSVTSIEDLAFMGCSGLTGSLILPNSVTFIGDFVFYNCTGLTSSLTLPNSVTSIGNGSFLNCRGLTNVTIGSGAITIGDYVFENCTGLQKISVTRSLPPAIYSNTFKGVNKETTVLEIPIGSKAAYQIAPYWKEFFLFNEADMTGTNETVMSGHQVKVYAGHSAIVVEGTSSGETVSLYTLNGVQVQSIKSQGERVLLPIQRERVYLVKTQSKTFKVIL